MESIITLLSPHVTVIVAALFAVSEALSLIPTVKANGVFQLAFGLIRKIAGKN